MALSGSQQAYTYARSGIARSAATRSNYVLAWSTVDLIVRDSAGNIVSRTDLTNYIRFGSLRVTQALNDEADTCSFEIVPTAPASAVPKVGQEIEVSWAPGADVFQGYALVVQFDRRARNESPWVAVQCQDSMWRFDARIVTCRFPAQSVTASIAYLVRWFCNALYPAASDFRLTYVQANMPAIASFEVINERPSTVMRTLLSAVGGAFYVDGLEVHAWAGSLSEPGQTDPAPLTNALETLKTFRMTQDATQLRKRVLVEGRRSDTLIPYPTMADASATNFLGVPLTDATLFAPETGVDAIYLGRVGSQWMLLRDPSVAAPQGANPPQTHVSFLFTPGDLQIWLGPVPFLPPARGWVLVAGQYTRYAGYVGNPIADAEWALTLPASSFPYGVLTVSVPAGETVYWVDAVMAFQPHGVVWLPGSVGPTQGDDAIRAQPAGTPVVTLATADRPLDTWPPLEGFVQDGRYSYAGALARANADLENFAQPLVTCEWETDDLNAQPGRQQVIHLTGSSVIDPLDTTVTITQVDLSFPLRTQPPRRRCTGGDVKPSTFLDLVVTDES
jgi:hypothetical protein